MLTKTESLKTVLNLSLTDTSVDNGLNEFIRRASAIVRRHCSRYLYGLYPTISKASPAVVTSIEHGLVTGDYVRFFDTGVSAFEGTSGLEVTVINRDSFSVASRQQFGRYDLAKAISSSG